MAKILVVEDDGLFAVILRGILENEGYEVLAANGVEEAYQGYLSFKPDLVITDIHMGRESGLDLIKRIRAGRPEIPVLYISGHINLVRPALEKEQRRYPVAFLAKPFFRVQLLGLVAQSLAALAGEKGATAHRRYSYAYKSQFDIN